MSRLLPYETVIQATNGEPEAVNAVLSFTARFLCNASFLNASKAVSISSSRSAGKPVVLFALLILLRQFWHSFL